VCAEVAAGLDQIAAQIHATDATHDFFEWDQSQLEDVSTTEIYTHVLNRGPFAVISPLHEVSLETLAPPPEFGERAHSNSVSSAVFIRCRPRARRE
jgi:hypothetical protein